MDKRFLRRLIFVTGRRLTGRNGWGSLLPWLVTSQTERRCVLNKFRRPRGSGLRHERCAMRCTASQFGLSLAALVVWPLLGAGDQARAGYLISTPAARPFLF